MRPIIKVQDLSKQYQIGTVRPPYQSLRESLTNGVRIPFRRREGGVPPRTETIWALKDVSFEIHPGEVVGIIGRNGAGKSTLLKILSRVSEPTTGRIELYGRIGSLLEVGTGFHPELTGRENVFLNGAILGMKRSEIRRKFDEIVAFSEIEKFIDTPVKWYSSGMYVRLAFSVSVHLEPEILILDEVLAVGDSEFQNKCLNKMEETRNSGTTILFVSHGMDAMTRLCKRAILFSNGIIIKDGPAKEVAKAYLGGGLKLSAERVWENLNQAPGDDVVRLVAVRVRDEMGQVSSYLDIRKSIAIEMEFEVLQPESVLVPNVHFYNEQRVCLFVSAENNPEARLPLTPGRYKSTVRIPGNFLADGKLMVSPALTTPGSDFAHFWEKEVLIVEIVDSFEADAVRGDYKEALPGVVRPQLSWTTNAVTAFERNELLIGEGSVA